MTCTRPDLPSLGLCCRGVFHDFHEICARAILRKGNPARYIVEVARVEGVDLIVIGNKGTGGLISWMLGSTSRSVAEACTVPVLIVKDREYCEA